jgi:hypothetical protein
VSKARFCKQMRSKKPNEMRSILLKGFGYAQLLRRRFEQSEKRQSSN